MSRIEEDQKRLSDALVVVLEIQQLLTQAPHPKTNTPLQLDQFIGHVCTFLCAYQQLSSSNWLAVTACSSQGAECLFSDLHSIGKSRDSLKNAGAANSVLSGLKMFVPGNASGQGSTCLSAALSKAICLVSSAKKRASRKGHGVNARILVLHSSPDVTGQYVAVMNAAFAARRLGVLIDGMPLLGHCSPFIELAADLTKGSYVECDRPEHLLQMLLSCFSADSRTREGMHLQSKGMVSQGSCFCHVRAIDMGFVCSVCLSVFCEHHDQCITCGTEFTVKEPA